MSLPKGDKIIIQTELLSGKYVVLETLGQGAFSTVYLARHQSLESLCAIKAVPKQLTQGLIILSEAQLLKSFHHKGIPEIYDFEEDNDYYYLIEEYIEGQRLDEWLLQQSKISIGSYCNILTQICDIFVYLHNHVPSPVIYQDLKPEHIYLCGDTVKLIDFGVSTLLTNLGQSQIFYGNLLFTPPEFTKGEAPSIASDIYSLGCLMDYLVEYLEDPLPQPIQYLIAQSIQEEPSSRIETVSQMRAVLQDVYQHFGKTHLSQHIAVIGCHSGCGSTHISISLTCALNANGYKAYYHEKNLSNSLRNAKAYMNLAESDGCYHCQNFHGYPLYGPGVELQYDANAYHIDDYGHDFHASELTHYDRILFVCDNAIWHRKAALEHMTALRPYKNRIQIIGNRCTHSTAIFYAKEFTLPILQYPEDLEVFRDSHNKQELLEHIFAMKGRRKQFFKRKNRIKGNP